MKKVIISILAISVLFIAGCSTKADKGDLNEKRTANTFEITPKELLSSPLGEDNQLVTIEIEVTNKDKGPLGIGAGDFFIRDEKGNKTKIYGQRENFGEVIEKGKSIKGKAYFKVPNSYSTFTLVYQPYETMDAEWKNLHVISE